NPTMGNTNSNRGDQFKRYSNGDYVGGLGSSFHSRYALYHRVGAAGKTWTAIYGRSDKEGRTMRVVTIRVDVDLDDEETHKVIVEAAVEAAKLLRAQAAILSGGRGLHVSVKTWKMYEEETVVPLDEEVPA